MADFDQANLDIVADTFALTEFQKIAMADILRELPNGLFENGDPQPGTREYDLIMELGRVASEGKSPQEFFDRL